ncbi:YceI family protein [Novosphingobium taihuense]|uniref:Cytochrome b561/polyisoprenoid-binding protein YceI n=1 Tax=Novosphingobium taihuense TaxID=260085 RepID=A0A7W7AB31_9SPHN|nr:YceI family protein [Novosphingobium taihuense]MBB4613596.1 cytochrome b561/polyisoprenoid-binding protein YceI [Novosphingobium taihuense]TWH81160.1 cytochrome b561 [Novosphingobium taihuense]
MTTLRPERYSATAIALHWAIALLLLFQIGLGWALEDLPKGAAQFAGYQFHKSVGITILLLSLVRLAVRLFRPRPEPVKDGRAQMLLASAVHGLLYAVMIGGPITGWIIVSTAKVRLQTMLFGKIPWPDLPVGQGFHEPAEVLHGALGTIGIILIGLHVAGALYHHFKREDVIGRMLPGAMKSHGVIGIAALVAIALGIGALICGRLLSFAPANLVTPPIPLPSASSEGDIAAPMESTAPEEPTAVVSESAVSSATATPWKLEKGGRLAFTAEYNGEAIKGSFSRWDATIVFDPEDLPGSSISVTIDLASVESGDSQRDDMLRSDSFFAVGTHPTAQFVSSSIRAAGEGRYVAKGTLLLHGQRKPLTVRFSLNIDGSRATASGNATLQRLAFGVGEAEWSATDQLRDAVGVDFNLKAVKKAR